MNLLRRLRIDANEDNIEEILDQRQREHGMSSNQIELLTTVKLTSDISKKLSEKEESCSICLDPFDEDSLVRELA